MYLRPCRACPHKDGCDRKAELIKVLPKGFGLTLVSFRCEKRLSQLQPGQVVLLTLCDREDSCDVDFTATVMRPQGTRILVWLDDNDEADAWRNPIAVAPNRVKPIKGPRKLCPECDQPEGTVPMIRVDGATKFVCLTCGPKT